MANINIDEIKELLQKHNYVIKVSKIDDSIYISCPSNYFLNLNEFTVTIDYDDENKTINIVSDNVTNSPISRNIECPKYAYGVLVPLYIANVCRVFGIDTRFIIYYIDNEEVSENTFIMQASSPDDMIDAPKSLLLQSFIIEYLNNLQDEDVSNKAIELDIFDGYNAIKKALYDE